MPREVNDAGGSSRTRGRRYVYVYDDESRDMLLRFFRQQQAADANLGG